MGSGHGDPGRGFMQTMQVTDNGSIFTSSEFTDFVKRNGIHHVCYIVPIPSIIQQAGGACSSDNEGWTDEIDQWLCRDKAISVSLSTDRVRRQSREFRQSKRLVDLFIRNWICCIQMFKRKCRVVKSCRSFIITISQGVVSLSVVT